VAALYDSIGRTYSGRRESDPRIAGAIVATIDGCDSILNVGAGAGSYEPASKSVVAIEPSRTMIAQRPRGAAPVVLGYAESLPFRDCSFDAVLGILTVHHWKDKEKGFSECCRVARSRVVFFTIDFAMCAQFWMFDYFPGLHIDQHIFPGMQRYADFFQRVEVIPVPIPADCRDGFLGAYWKRPRAYLDPLVRGSISTFSRIGDIGADLARLETDIESGAWERRYSKLQNLSELDLGYRLVIADAGHADRKRA
jgi:SAM-dependent methyltransferase